MSHASSGSSPTALRAPPPCAWTVWPLRGGLGGAALAVGIAATAAVVGSATGSMFWAVVGAAVIAAAAWRAIVPTEYELGPIGLAVSVLGRQRRIPWRSIGRCQICERGLFLTSAPSAGPLDALSGQFVPWGSRREEVLALVTYYIPRSRVVDGSTPAAAAVASTQRGSQASATPADGVAPPDSQAGESAPSTAESAGSAVVGNQPD